MFSEVNNFAALSHPSNEGENNFERLDSNAFLDLFCEALNNPESLYSDLKFYPAFMNRITLEIGNDKIDVNKFLQNSKVVTALENIHKKPKASVDDNEIELKLVEFAFANENFFNALIAAIKKNQGLRFQIEIFEQIIKVKLIGNNSDSTKKILNFLSILGKISGKSISVSMRKCKPREIILPENVKIFEIFDCNNLQKITVPKSLKKISINSCDDLKEVVHCEHGIEEVEVINCNKLTDRSKIHLLKNLFQKNVSKTFKKIDKTGLFEKVNEIRERLNILIEEFELEFVLKNIDSIFKFLYNLSENNKNQFLFELAYIVMEKDVNLFFDHIDLFPIKEDPSLFEAILKDNINFHLWKEISNFNINYTRISSEKIKKSLETNQDLSITTGYIRDELTSLLKKINFQNPNAPHYIDFNKITLDGHPIKNYHGFLHCYDTDPWSMYYSAISGINAIIYESQLSNENGLKIKKNLSNFIKLAKSHSSFTLVSKTFMELMMYFNFYCVDRKISELEDANRVLNTFFHIETQTLDDMILQWIDFYKEGILNAITFKYSPQFYETHQLHLRNLIAKLMLRQIGLPKHLNINVRDVSMTEKFIKKIIKINGPDAPVWAPQRKTKREVQNPQHLDIKSLGKNLSISFESIKDEIFFFLKAPFLADYVKQQINEMLNNSKNFNLVLDLLTQFSNDLIPSEVEENAFFEKVNLGIKRAEAVVFENRIRIAILDRNTSNLNKIKAEYPTKRLLISTLENEYRQMEKMSGQVIASKLEFLRKSNSQLIEILQTNNQVKLAEFGHEDYQQEMRLKRDGIISDYIEQKGFIIRNPDDSFKITFEGTLFLLHKLKFLNLPHDTIDQQKETVINAEELNDAKKLIDFFDENPKDALSILNSILLDTFNFYIVKERYKLSDNCLLWLKDPVSQSQIKRLIRNPAFLKELIKNIKSDFSSHLTDMINLFAFARNECNEQIYNEILFLVSQKNSDLILDECFFVKDNWSLIKSYPSNHPVIWENFISQKVNHSKLSCITKKKDESIANFETDFKPFIKLCDNIFSNEKLIDFANTPSEALEQVKNEIRNEKYVKREKENQERKRLELPLLKENDNQEDESNIVHEIKTFINSKVEKIVESAVEKSDDNIYYNSQLKKLVIHISEYKDQEELFKHILELLLVSDRYCIDGKKKSLDWAVKILNPNIGRIDDDIESIDTLIYRWMDEYKFGVIGAVTVKFSDQIVENKGMEVHLANHVAYCMRKYFSPPEAHDLEYVDGFYKKYISNLDGTEEFWDRALSQEILSHFISPLMTAYVKHRANIMIKETPKKADLVLDILKEYAEKKLNQKFNELNEKLEDQAYEKGIQAIEKRNLENIMRRAIFQDNQPEIASFKKNAQFQQISQEIKRIELEDNEDFIEEENPNDSISEEIENETNPLTKRKGNFSSKVEPSAKRQKTKGEEYPQRGIKRKSESDIDDGLNTKRQKIEQEVQKKIESDTILLQNPLVHVKKITEAGLSSARSAIWLEKDQLITDFLQQENLIKGELWDNTFEITLEGANVILEHFKYLIKNDG